MTKLQKIGTYVTQEEKIRLRTIAASQDMGMSELLKCFIDICLADMEQYTLIGQWFEERGK